MTPYQRLVIALRHGVLVKRSKAMRYGASVVHLTARPQDDDRFDVVPIEASNEMDAARKVAEIAAARKYEEDGCVGFLSPTHRGSGWFRASIGEQRRSAEGVTLVGLTISIHVWPAE